MVNFVSQKAIDMYHYGDGLTAKVGDYGERVTDSGLVGSGRSSVRTKDAQGMVTCAIRAIMTVIFVYLVYSVTYDSG